MSDTLLGPDSGTKQILDGRNTEFLGSGVFLLPPIGTQQGIVRQGPFDIEADPRVEICELADIPANPTEDDIESAECGPNRVWFERDAAYDGVTFIEVTPTPGGPAVADSQFSLRWDTDESQAGTGLRVFVMLPDLKVGPSGVTVEYKTAASFDGYLQQNSSGALDASRVVGSVAGQVFPLKFIVEETAQCDGLDCFAKKVTCDASAPQTTHAGAYFQQNWASECLDPTTADQVWWLYQERIQGPCLPAGEFAGREFDPCYVWQLVTESGADDGSFAKYTSTFNIPVTVHFCVEGEALDWHHLLGIFRISDPAEGVALVPGAEPKIQIECPFVPSAQPSGLAGLTRSLFAPALKLFGLEPRPLYAANKGDAGDAIRMSEFAWVLSMYGEAAGPTNLAGIVGSTLEDALQYRLLTPPHEEPFLQPAGVFDYRTIVRVVSGDATPTATGAEPCPDGSGGFIDRCIIVLSSSDLESTPEDEGGYVTASLILGSTPGPVVVEIEPEGDLGVAPVVYTVDAVDLLLKFREPLEPKDAGLDTDFEALVPTVLICPLASIPCTEATAEAVFTAAAGDVSLVQEDTGRKFYKVTNGWKPVDTNASLGLYKVQVNVGGAVVGHSILIETVKGGRSELVEGDRYYAGQRSSVQIQFTLSRVTP